MNTSFEACQERIKQYLGQQFPHYMKLVKDYVHSTISLDEFDVQARGFFDSNSVIVHENYLVALLNKLQKSEQGSQIRRQPPAKKAKMTPAPVSTKFREIFPEKLPPPLPEVDRKKIEVSLENTVTCADHLRLPENWMIHGRLLATAMEHGLTDVQDNAVHLMVVGTRIFLKNLIDSTLVKVSRTLRSTASPHSFPSGNGNLAGSHMKPGSSRASISSFLSAPTVLFPRRSVFGIGGHCDSSPPSPTVPSADGLSTPVTTSSIPLYTSESGPIRQLTIAHLYRFLLDPIAPAKNPELKFIHKRYEVCPNNILRTRCLERAAGLLWRHHHLNVASAISDIDRGLESETLSHPGPETSRQKIQQPPSIASASNSPQKQYAETNPPSIPYSIT